MKLFLLLLVAVTPASESGFSDDILLTHRLMSLSAKYRERPSYKNVLQLVKVAKHLEQTCLPNILIAEDYLAMAWVESRFNPRAVGKAGEHGAWQVLEWKHYLKRTGGVDSFNIETNGQMVCAELREKYKWHKTYQKTITSYNGLSPRGRIYFKRVTVIRKQIVSSS